MSSASDLGLRHVPATSEATRLPEAERRLEVVDRPGEDTPEGSLRRRHVTQTQVRETDQVDARGLGAPGLGPLEHEEVGERGREVVDVVTMARAASALPEEPLVDGDRGIPVAQAPRSAIARQ